MKRKNYASDISQEKFADIESLLSSVRQRTKPTTVDQYKVFCAVLYVLRTGCQWRFLPSEWPKWQTVYSCFAKWRNLVSGLGCISYQAIEQLASVACKKFAVRMAAAGCKVFIDAAMQSMNQVPSSTGLVHCTLDLQDEMA